MTDQPKRDGPILGRDAELPDPCGSQLFRESGTGGHRKWAPNLRADVPGERSVDLWDWRRAFLEAVQKWHPEVPDRLKREVAPVWLAGPRCEVLTVVQQEAQYTPLLHALDGWASVHGLAVNWIKQEALSTLAHASTRSLVGDERLRWWDRAYEDSARHRYSTVPPVRWDPRELTREEARARFERYCEAVIDAALEDGLVQVRIKETKSSRGRRLMFVASHVIGGLSYERIADEYSRAHPGKYITAAAIAKHVIALCRTLPLPLPSKGRTRPIRSRRSR